MRTVALLITILDLIADAIDLAMLSVSVALCSPFKLAADLLENLLEVACDPGGDGFEPEDDGNASKRKTKKESDTDEWTKF